ncbi:MAG: thioredoxin domain-containing protein, partial [Bdellovibrionales bacterium]
MNPNRVNLLQNEKSPYLLQHKDNPIAWMPWGPEAFRMAREEKKPVFLSVGYSTCHWCHVMAHESFEDAEVAEVLNKDFICIKVDREENPDVDQIYMSALQALSGGGGWPMSLWLTAEGKPFFAGTYFPKFRFLQLLRRIQEIWTTEPEKLTADSDRLLETIRDMEKSEPREGSEAEYEEFLKAYVTHFQHHFDVENGGFGGAPKFPQTMNLMVMMRQDFKSGLRQAEAMVNTTLLKMVRGGVYDQLAGGFHRYSVDEKWLVPHFEKMLYDQAMLTITLVEAYQMYGEPELARATRETLDYVLREMTHPSGGFYSAQDADSLNPVVAHKEEGYFCTYDYTELRNLLTIDELTILEKAYGLTPEGNFEGRTILHLQDDYDGSVLKDPLILSAFEKLRKLRASRPAPHL